MVAVSPLREMAAPTPVRVAHPGAAGRVAAAKSGTPSQVLRRRPLTSLEVLWRVQTPGTPVSGVCPLTDGAPAGTWRGETDASGLHGGDLAVGLARMLLQSVPMG